MFGGYVNIDLKAFFEDQGKGLRPYKVDWSQFPAKYVLDVTVFNLNELLSLGSDREPIFHKTQANGHRYYTRVCPCCLRDARGRGLNPRGGLVRCQNACYTFCLGDLPGTLANCTPSMADKKTKWFWYYLNGRPVICCNGVKIHDLDLTYPLARKINIGINDLMAELTSKTKQAGRSLPTVAIKTVYECSKVHRHGLPPRDDDEDNFLREVGMRREGDRDNAVPEALEESDVQKFIDELGIVPAQQFAAAHMQDTSNNPDARTLRIRAAQAGNVDQTMRDRPSYAQELPSSLTFESVARFITGRIPKVRHSTTLVVAVGKNAMKTGNMSMKNIDKYISYAERNKSGLLSNGQEAEFDSCSPYDTIAIRQRLVCH